MEDLELSARACESLVKELGDKMVAVVLFGNRARARPLREATSTS